jgi:hypothetical protein
MARASNCTAIPIPPTTLNFSQREKVRFLLAFGAGD